MSVPISIEGNYYDPDQFVLHINRGYLRVAKFAQGRPLFQRYVSRCQTGAVTHRLLERFYSPVAAEAFNGVSVWEERFKTFLHKNANRYSDSYLKSILLPPLGQFIAEHYEPGSEPTVDIKQIDTYRAYIEASIECGYVPRLDIRWRPKFGWGLFAAEPIYPFMFLGLYSGTHRVTKWVRLIERLRLYKNRYKWALYNNENFLIDAEASGNHTRFINHDARQTGRVDVISLQLQLQSETPSPDCSSVSLPHRGLIAFRPEPRQNPSSFVFDKEEEVLWSYGPHFHF